jgi:hypothetical protein
MENTLVLLPERDEYGPHRFRLYKVNYNDNYAKITMTSEEKFNQDIWWLLQKIKKIRANKIASR